MDHDARQRFARDARADHPRQTTKYKGSGATNNAANFVCIRCDDRLSADDDDDDDEKDEHGHDNR